MTPAEAYHVLQLEPGAGREQIERHHAEQKQILREKRAKAHAPGLKAHIQQGLSRLDTAREVLIHREDVASGLARSRREGSANSLASPAAREVRSVTAADVDAAVDRLPRRLNRHAEGLVYALLALLAGAAVGAILVLFSVGSADRRALWVGGGGLVGLVPGILWWRATVGRLRRDEWVKVREALARGEERPVAWRRPVRRLALALLLLLAGGVGYRRWTPAAWPNSGEPALARVGRLREEAPAADDDAGGSGGDDRGAGTAPVSLTREAPVGAVGTDGKQPVEHGPAETPSSAPRRSAMPAGTVLGESQAAQASSAGTWAEGAGAAEMRAATGAAAPEIPGRAEEGRASAEKAKREIGDSAPEERVDTLSRETAPGRTPTSALLARLPYGDRAPANRESGPTFSSDRPLAGGGRSMPPAAVAGVHAEAAHGGGAESEKSRASQGRTFHARAVGLREAKRPGLALFALEQARVAGRADTALAASLRQEFTDAQALTVWQAPPRAQGAEGSDPPREAANLAAVATNLNEALRDSLVPVLPALVTLERAEGAFVPAPQQPRLLLRVEAGITTDGEDSGEESDAEGSRAVRSAGTQARTLQAQVVLVSRELAGGEALLMEVTASRSGGPKTRSTTEEEAAIWAAMQAEIRGQLQGRRREVLTKLAAATLSVVRAQRGAAEGNAEETQGELEWGWFAVWTEAGLSLPQHEAERAARRALALPEAVAVGL